MPYSVFGEGKRTVLLMPPWSLASSRIWKMQVPYLAARHRVITVEPRGAGGADTPRRSRDYAEPELAADCLAVLDACGVERCTLVSHSRGAQRTLLLSTEHPDRVDGAVFAALLFPVTRPSTVARLSLTEPFKQLFRLPGAPIPGDVGELVRQFNAPAWRRDYPAFVRWFIARTASAPYSSRVWEEAVEWALEAGPEVLIASWLGPTPPMSRPRQRALAGQMRCPVLVISGTADRITPHADARALAAAARGQLYVIEGGDHAAIVRRPVEVNLALSGFLEGLDASSARHRHQDERRAPEATTGLAPASDGADTVAPPPRRRPGTGPGRVLYVSSPIGLGHVRRDLAIAQQMRELRPGLAIDWLAEDPVTRLLSAAGERILPASGRLSSESRHWTAAASGHRLQALEAFRAMNEINLANYMVFRDATVAERYDLVIADEGWFVDYYLHEDPRQKRFAYAWLADFIGVTAVPEDDETQAVRARAGARGARLGR